MLAQYIVHFLGRNFLTATIDDLFEASGEKQVALGIEAPLVTGVKPAVCECTLVGLGIVLVAAGDIGATDNNLTDFSSGEQIPGFTHDRDIRSRGDPH